MGEGISYRLNTQEKPGGKTLSAKTPNQSDPANKQTWNPTVYGPLPMMWGAF